MNPPTMGSWARMSSAAVTRRALAPLAIVTAAALLFAFLLIVVRLQWGPLEAADHRAAAGLNSLVAGHAAAVSVGKAVTWLGCNRVLWTGAGGAARDLPAGGGRWGPDARPGPEGDGGPAAPGGLPSDRVRDRQQLPQRARSGVDRLLRRPVPGLPARDPGDVAARVQRRDRRADRRDRRQPAPA